MIKAKNLRIGDLVNANYYNIITKGTVCSITEIISARALDDKKALVTIKPVNCIAGNEWKVWCRSIEGIPLTPKILENNGWKLYEPSTKMYIKSNSNLAVCFPPHSDKVQVYYVVEHLRTIKYVHEFQHILWALGMDADLKIPEKSDGKEAKP